MQYVLQNLACVLADITKDGATFRIGAVHFLWSRNGLSSNEQRSALPHLLSTLEEERQLVFAGDFNAPRGGEIFSEFAKRYVDTIPAHYVTSLDLNLHRAVKEGKRNEIENKMVDGLFTTPAYIASDVRLVDGVSDHCAIVATIAKAT